MNQCATQLNVRPDIIHKYVTDNTIDKKQIGCLYSCILEKLGAINNGNFVEEKIAEFIQRMHKDNVDQREGMMKTALTCAHKVGDVEDVCEKSIQYIECIYVDGEKYLT